jgi:hypothetical protein
LQDVADFMLDPAAAGYTSESELDTDAEVEVVSAAPVTVSRRSKDENGGTVQILDFPATEPDPWRVLTERVVERSGWARSFPTTTEMHRPAAIEPDDEDD